MPSGDAPPSLLVRRRARSTAFRTALLAVAAFAAVCTLLFLFGCGGTCTSYEGRRARQLPDAAGGRIDASEGAPRVACAPSGPASGANLSTAARLVRLRPLLNSWTPPSAYGDLSPDAIFAEDPWLVELEDIVRTEARERLAPTHPRLRVLMIDQHGTLVRAHNNRDQWGPLRKWWDAHAQHGIIPHAVIREAWRRLFEFESAQRHEEVMYANETAYNFFYECSSVRQMGSKCLNCLVKNLVGTILAWEADLFIPREPPSSVGGDPSRIFEPYGLIVNYGWFPQGSHHTWMPVFRALKKPKLWMASEAHVAVCPTRRFLQPLMDPQRSGFCPVILDWFMLPESCWRADMHDVRTGRLRYNTVPFFLTHAVEQYRTMYGPLPRWEDRTGVVARDLNTSEVPEMIHRRAGALDEWTEHPFGNGLWFRFLAGVKYLFNGPANRYSTGQMIQDASIMGALVFGDATRWCSRALLPSFCRFASQKEAVQKALLVEHSPAVAAYLRGQVERRLQLFDMRNAPSPFQVLQRVWESELGDDDNCGKQFFSEGLRAPTEF